MKPLLFILITLSLASCDPKPEIKKQIAGTWQLTKTVTTRGTFANKNESDKYTFHIDGTYTHTSTGYDVIIDEKGFFEITDDPNPPPTHLLILKGKVEPNSYGDTIRQHSSMKIITLSGDSLVLAYQMRFLYDTFPKKTYNRIDYYRRQE